MESFSELWKRTEENMRVPFLKLHQPFPEAGKKKNFRNLRTAGVRRGYWFMSSTAGGQKMQGFPEGICGFCEIKT